MVDRMSLLAALELLAALNLLAALDLTDLQRSRSCSGSDCELMRREKSGV